MRAALQYTAIALLVLGLSGCAAKKTAKTKQTTQAQAPTTTASTATGRGTLTPPTIGQQQDAKDIPPLPATTLPQVEPPKPAPPSAQQPKHKTARHKSNPKQTPDTAKPAGDTSAPAPAGTSAANQNPAAAPPSQAAPAPASKPAQQAEAAESVSSPIGQLTTGDSASGAQTKRDTTDLINTTEQGLNGIKRPLSRDEQTTATKIRTFLSQAKQALKNGDVDGAHTLAVKAKLLLDELTTP